MTNKLLKAKTMRKYADDAGKMTRGELEQAYVKCKFGRTSFFSVPKSFLDDIKIEE